MKTIDAHLFHALHALSAPMLAHGALLLLECLLGLWLVRRFTGSLMTSRAKGAALHTNLAHAHVCVRHLATTSNELSQRTALQVARSASFTPAWERLAAWVPPTLAAVQTITLMQAEQRARALSGHALREEMAGALASMIAAGQDNAKLLADADEVAFLIHVLSLNVSVQAALPANDSNPATRLAALAEELRVLAQRSADAVGGAMLRVQESAARAGAATALVDRLARLEDEVTSANARTQGLLARLTEAAEPVKWVAQLSAALKAETFAHGENVKSAMVNGQETARIALALQAMEALLNGVARPQAMPAGAFDDSGVLCQPQT